MKKSTKILTVLLAACLLFGISSAFVTSAAETNVLNVTNNPANFVDDCTSGPSGTVYDCGATGNSLKFGYENSVKSQYITGTHLKDNTGDNTYFRVHYTNGALESPGEASIMREGSTRWRAYTAYNSAADLKNFSYVTLDFDFAADQYAYSFTLDGVTQYKTAASDEEFKAYLATLTADPAKVDALYEEAIATRDLAFPVDKDIYTSLRFNAVFQSSVVSTPGSALTQSSSSAHWKQVHVDGVTVYKIDDAWHLVYATPGSNEVLASVKLSNKVGIFDHVTMVFQLLDGGLTVRTHVYVNGMYMTQLADKKMDGAAATHNIFYHLNIPFYRDTRGANVPGDKMYDKYSFAFDNMALNHYTPADAELPGGLGEFMASDKYKTQSMTDCTNVVYNGDYVSPNAPIRASITHIDGTQINCYTKNSVYKNIRNGDLVTMYYDVEDYSPSSDEIREVTFISKDGTKVNLSKEALENFKIQHTNDRYTIRFGGENDMPIKWFDATGESRKVVKEQKLFPLLKPANNLIVGGDIEYPEGQNPNIGLLKSWMWDVNCNGVIEETDKPGSDILDRIFTMKEINEELREEGIHEIHMLPDYGREDIKYTIMTGGENPELYAPDYDFAKFTDISTLLNAVSKLEKEGTYCVTLYSDLELSAAEAFAIPKEVILDFDLNGYHINQSAESGSAIFTLNENVTFTLYSTKEGAEVYQNGEDLTGSAIISAADNLDKVTVNLGKITETDPKGDNLAMYGASIVYLKGAADDASNETKITVNVNGGNYYGTVAANGALFPISEIDMVFNFNAADMITVNGEAIFSVIPEYATSSVIDVTNSNIFAGELSDGGYVIGSFVKDWAPTSKLYIKNSVVLGFENQLNITVGAGNKFNAVISNDIAYDSGTLVAFANNNAYPMQAVIDVPGFETLTADVDITLVTFTKDTMEDSIKTVSWLAPDGSVLKTNYWVAGSKVSVFESTEDFADVDLDNKWFDISYDGWVNVTDGAEKNDFTVSLDKDNKFKPAEKYVADLKSLKVSLTVFDGLAYNIYVPTPTLENYEMNFLGFFDEAGNQILTNVYNNVTVDGTNGWNQLIGLFASEKFAAQTVTVKYTVNGQEVSCDVTIDIFNYAYKIDTTYGCGSAESKLVYAMMQYKYEAFVASEPTEELKAIVDLEMNKYYSFHSEDCTCGDVEYEEPTVTADDSAISALVTKYSFALLVDESNSFASKYAFSIYLTEEATVKINGTTVTGVAKDGGVEYTLTGIALKDLANNITIEIGSKSGTYSLAKYLNDTNNGFAKALYVLSVNAKNQNA